MWLRSGIRFCFNLLLTFRGKYVLFLCPITYIPNISRKFKEIPKPEGNTHFDLEWVSLMVLRNWLDTPDGGVKNMPKINDLYPCGRWLGEIIRALQYAVGDLALYLGKLFEEKGKTPLRNSTERDFTKCPFERRTSQEQEMFRDTSRSSMRSSQEKGTKETINTQLQHHRRGMKF